MVRRFKRDNDNIKFLLDFLKLSHLGRKLKDNHCNLHCI